MIFAVCAGAVMLALAGCVSTVNDRTSPGVPFVQDKFVSNYQRTVEDCYAAAKSVVSEMGTVTHDGNIYTTNSIAPVKYVQGKVNQRDVWVRLALKDPSVTSVTVQTRTPGGGGDLDLAREIDKRIALKLVAR